MRSALSLALSGLLGGAVGSAGAWLLCGPSAPGADSRHQASDFAALRHDLDSLVRDARGPTLLGVRDPLAERVASLETSVAALNSIVQELLEGRAASTPARPFDPPRGESHRRELFEEVRRRAEASPHGRDPGFGERVAAVVAYLRAYPSDSESEPLLMELFSELMEARDTKLGSQLATEYGQSVGLPEWRVDQLLLQGASVAGAPAEMRVAAQRVATSRDAPDWARAQAMFSEGTAWVMERRHPFARHVYERIVAEFGKMSAPSVSQIVNAAKGKVQSYEESGVKASTPP